MKKTVLFVSITLLVLGVCAQVSWEQPVHQPATATAASIARSAPLEPPPAAVPSRPTLRHADPEDLFLRSSVALVLDEEEKVVLYGRNIEEQRPIASLTKLMTAMVCLDAGLPLDEEIRIVRADRDRLRGSGSRLSFGTILSRYDTLSIALAASENRAAHALARTYPGGKKAFVEAMNAKARQLGMEHTQFHDSSGLNSGNVSTARDLVKLVEAAGGYELIREMTTEAKGSVTDLRSGWKVEFLNTNRLVRKKDWKIGLSKTGYIADAGNCLVMKTEISDRPVIIVLLNSWGKLSKYGDSNRIRKWLLHAEETARIQHPDGTSQSS
jgi:D-alanyl-D-alanine endopeptidase (penicillin-binding protein 7)